MPGTCWESETDNGGGCSGASGASGEGDRKQLFVMDAKTGWHLREGPGNLVGHGPMYPLLRTLGHTGRHVD